MRNLLLTALAVATTASADDVLMYVGTFDRGPYVATVDTEFGQVSDLRKAADLDRPSFVAISPISRSLYSVAAKDGGSEVVAFRMAANGDLTELNRQDAGGPGACHVCVSPNGRAVFTANYSGGQVASYRVARDGSLEKRVTVVTHEGGSGVNAKRQEAAHPHSVNVSPDGRHLYVCDLGQDRIAIYDINPKTFAIKPSAPPETKTPPGGGPRHLSFSPDFRYAAANMELTGDVVLYAWDRKTGGLTQIDVASSVPKFEGDVANKSAECLFAPIASSPGVSYGDAQLVYVTNRGADTDLATMMVQDGRLSFHSGAGFDVVETPRGFGVTRDGRFAVICGQDNDRIQALRLTQGSANNVGSFYRVPKPVNVRFVESPAAPAG